MRAIKRWKGLSSYDHSPIKCIGNWSACFTNSGTILWRRRVANQDTGFYPYFSQLHWRQTKSHYLLEKQFAIQISPTEPPMWWPRRYSTECYWPWASRIQTSKRIQREAPRGKNRGRPIYGWKESGTNEHSRACINMRGLQRILLMVEFGKGLRAGQL